MRAIIARVSSMAKERHVSLWFGLNILDSVLTYKGVSLGAAEKCLVYILTRNALLETVGQYTVSDIIATSMLVATVTKYAVVILVVLALRLAGRLCWLKWFNLGISLVVAWNLYVLLEWALR